MGRSLYFPKRLPEPETMSHVENDSFAVVARERYPLWFVPLADHAAQMSKITDGRILDMACGPGLLTKALRERLPAARITAADWSKSALVIAKKNVKTPAHIDWKRVDVANQPFTDNTFDLVTCRDSFHHFPDALQALREMRRVLAPGGTLYIQDLRRDLPWTLLREAVPQATVFQRLQYISVQASYTIPEMRRLLRQAGFRRFRVWVRRLTPAVVRQFARTSKEREILRRSFQAHYIAVATK